MDDYSRIDGWLSFLLGGVLAFVAGLKSFFNLKSRVESNERDIKGLKDDHNARLMSIENQITAVRNEVRQDIKDAGDRTEKRHDTLEEMMRVVIQRVK